MSWKTIRTSLLGAALALTLGACGGSESGSLTVTQSKQALSAVTNAQAVIDKELTAAQSGGKSGLVVVQKGDTFTVTGKLTSAAGGTMQVSGSGNLDGQDITADFAAWKDAEGDLTMTGKLAIHTAVTMTAITTTEKGDLALAGAVTGTASFDISVQVTGACSNTSGTISGNSISVKVGC